MVWSWRRKAKETKFLSEDKNKDYYMESKNVANLNKMSGEDFEIFLKDLFIDAGYDADLTQKFKDDGIDIILTYGKEKVAIQAKRWDPFKKYKLVDKDIVNGLVSGARRRGIEKTCIITTTFFTDNAQAIAKQEKMELIDGRRLYYLIAKIKPESLAEAYFETLGYTKCPDCRSGILKKRKSKSEFIGCTNFPKCGYTMNISDYELQYGKK